MRIRRFVLLALLLAFSTSSHAHHKPGHHIPPGQMKKMYNPELAVPAEVEHVCVVTSEVAGDPYSRVVFTEWLPRPEAEAKADLGSSFVVYHPDVNTEEGCATF